MKKVVLAAVLACVAGGAMAGGTIHQTRASTMREAYDAIYDVKQACKSVGNVSFVDVVCPSMAMAAVNSNNSVKQVVNKATRNRINELGGASVGTSWLPIGPQFINESIVKQASKILNELKDNYGITSTADYCNAYNYGC